MMLMIGLIPGCRQKTPAVSPEEYNQIQQHMVGVNRILIKNDRQRILGYIERQKLEMHETGTGLWYLIENKGNGLKAQKGKIATIQYQISLLDGTPCYNSKKDGPKTFMIGKGGVESGLEEGILMLNEGGKEKLIIPPYLAHGLLGDEKKIPARAIIIYDLELISLQ
jgi:FKBP-type peptidyl-prolyl cis-trans isomerase FkpA